MQKQTLAWDIIENIKPHHNLVFYGAGEVGAEVFDFFSQKGLNVSFFCDTDSKKWGHHHCGTEIISPVKLKEIESLFLVVTVGAEKFESIALTLYGLNLKTDEIFFCDFSSHKQSKTSNHQKNYFDLSHTSLGYIFPRLLEEAYSMVEKFDMEYYNSLSFYKAMNTGNYVTWQDIKTPHINVSLGTRKTFYAPEDNAALPRVYFMGDSRVFGALVEDKHTIASFLQNRLQTHLVINKGSFAQGIFLFSQLLLEIQLKDNDIVIFGLKQGIGSDVFLKYLQEMNDYCNKHGAKLIYMFLPSVHEIINPSACERLRQSAIEFLKDGINEQIRDGAVEEAQDFCSVNGIAFIDFRKHFARPHSYGEVFADNGHYSPNGARLVADKLYEFLTINKAADNISDEALEEHLELCRSQLKRNQSFEQLVEQFIEDLSRFIDEKGENGAIVMNCNPFTLGHRYLIETAAKQVDKLFVFILQEEQNTFSFQDRIMLVKKGTKDLENVIVMPSSGFIISKLTFPEYFDKDMLKSENVDCSKDISIFCEKIAPKLRIKKRFVGTEPFCPVTSSYNKQMQDTLPKFGIEFVIIDRVEVGGTPVSASAVRRALADSDFDSIKSLVPPSTLEYLMQTR